MSIALIFWVIMLISLVFGLVNNWPVAGQRPWPLANSFVIWLLLFLLGRAVFGAAVHR